MSDDADFDEAFRREVARVAKAVHEVVWQFRDTVPLDAAVNAVIWVLADLLAEKPPSYPMRPMARQVADLLCEEVAVRRGGEEKPVLH